VWKRRGREGKRLRDPATKRKVVSASIQAEKDSLLLPARRGGKGRKDKRRNFNIEIALLAKRGERINRIGIRAEKEKKKEGAPPRLPSKRRKGENEQGGVALAKEKTTAALEQVTEEEKHERA